MVVAMLQHIGTPGASLSRLTATSGRSRVAAGRRGENDTKRVLSQMFRSETDVWAFHDLRVPGSKGRDGQDANIDHVLFRGKQVIVLDSKRWSPGVYYTIRGRSFRLPLKRSPWCDKATVGMAVDRLRRYLPQDAVVSGAILVHASGVGSVSLWFLRPPGREVIFPAVSVRAERWIRGTLGGEAPPDREIGAALRRLVQSQAS